MLVYIYTSNGGLSDRSPIQTSILTLESSVGTYLCPLSDYIGMNVIAITIGNGECSNRLASPCEWANITYLS